MKRAPARRRGCGAGCGAAALGCQLVRLRQQAGGLERSQKARGCADGGGVLTAMQCAGSRGVGEAFKHSTASTWRGEDDRGRVCGVWWWRGLLDDVVAVLDTPHWFFDPLDAESDGS
jgi:hypothetical protein